MNNIENHAWNFDKKNRLLCAIGEGLYSVEKN